VTVGYQLRTKTVKDEKGDLFADSHSISVRWKNHFPQLLNAYVVNDFRQTEMHTAVTLLSEPSTFEIELAIEKLKSHKFPGIDDNPTELIKARDRTTRSKIHKLIISIWNKEELPEEWKESIIVHIYKKGEKTECSNYIGILILPTTYKILMNTLL